MIVMTFSPSMRLTSAFQFVVPVAEMPFTVTDATAVSSEAVPETMIVGVVTVVPAMGEVMERDGEVVSMVTSSS